MAQRVTYRVLPDEGWTGHACWAFLYQLLYPCTIEYHLKLDTLTDRVLIDEYLNELCKFDWKVLISRKADPDYIFQFHMEDTTDALLVLGLGSLIRYIDEYPEWVHEWKRLRAFMPPSQAFLLCNLSRFAIGGHCFTGSLSKLTRLEDFNLQEFIDLVRDHKYKLTDPGLFKSIEKTSAFDSVVKFPLTMKFTEQLYKRFIELEPITKKNAIELTNLLTEKVYEPFSVSDLP